MRVPGRVAFAVLATVGVAILGFLARAMIAPVPRREALKAALDSRLAREQPTARLPPVPDSGNAAPAIGKAMDALQVPAGTAFNGAFDSIRRYQESRDAALPPDLADLMGRNRDALALLADAVARPTCRFRVDTDLGDAVARDLPADGNPFRESGLDLIRVKFAATLLQVRAERDAREGRTGEAIAGLDLLRRWADHHRQGGWWTVGTGQTLRGMALDLIARLLESPAMDGSAVERLLRDLPGPAEPWQGVKGTQLRIAFEVHLDWRRMLDMDPEGNAEDRLRRQVPSPLRWEGRVLPPSPNPWNGLSSRTMPVQELWEPAWNASEADLTEVDGALASYGGMASPAGLRSWPTLREFDSPLEIEKGPGGRPSLRSGWSRLAGWDLRARLLEETRVEALRCACAVRLFEIRRGSLPERLESLVPDLLPSLPVDPFTGLPFRYRVEPDAFRIWSPGADGTEAGRIPSFANPGFEIRRWPKGEAPHEAR